MPSFWVATEGDLQAACAAWSLQPGSEKAHFRRHFSVTGLDTPFVLYYNVGGPFRRTFVVVTTPRMMLKAVRRPQLAALDGTGRLNAQGKKVAIISTTDLAQHVHEIAYVLLSRGESEAELGLALHIVQAYVSLALEMYKAATDETRRMARLDIQDWGPEWQWDPPTTLNDGAKGIRRAWLHLNATWTPAPQSRGAAAAGASTGPEDGSATEWIFAAFHKHDGNWDAITRDSDYAERADRCDKMDVLVARTMWENVQVPRDVEVAGPVVEGCPPPC
jgi:hypothetical protein